MTTPRRMILDTDIGTDVDDAYALALAARSPEIDLVGVTTVSGDTLLRARVARRLLELLDRRDVPVAAGTSETLSAAAPHDPMLGSEGEGLLQPEEVVAGIAPEKAPVLIAKLLEASKAPTTIACIGAVTNLALTLRLYPELATRIDAIVLMGACLRPLIVGGVQLPGHYEHNLNCDPEAAEIVLRCGRPIKIVPAEITFNAVLRMASLERVRAKGTPLTNAISAMGDIFRPHLADLLLRMGVSKAFVDDMGIMLHDPLAISSVIRPEFLTFETMRFRTARDTEGRFFTLFDSEGDIEAEVAVSADYAGFEHFLLERILSA